MTPERLRECLSLLGWSQNHLADVLGLKRPDLVQRWARGASGYTVPEPVAEWIEWLATTVQELRATRPPPADWKRRR